ncbi:hypothetical protein BU14_0470s0013 [Porphyra umbilicalis]|uniref:Uncharacterized protein n=1 Tax=Porphyra umbilicalis TaxID=2786 RepID=A0A1X6NU10_PORUM|nr:hypothetical protein BU14_0470s0013 [Porphyra umbilicalis]|eukprot:OSX72084.1 hypothetical protein BU14_0470s0013 [Porphyra umbilicalis]
MTPNEPLKADTTQKPSALSPPPRKPARGRPAFKRTELPPPAASAGPPRIAPSVSSPPWPPAQAR